ncbi:MAG: protein-export chaperone SecB [Neisseriaceae bacterium]|nr:protein-export chaperone SecB [Neisseriaceae bacterium]
MANEEKQPIFNVERIYVKNASLELPHAPEILLVQEAPSVEVKLALNSKALEDNFYESSLTATVTATLEDKRVMFLAEANVAGIFRMENIPEGDIDPVLNITYQNILFPYVRENISNLIVRAGFPPIYLSPINFEAMYQQQQQNKQAAN